MNRGDKLLCFYTNAASKISGFELFSERFRLREHGLSLKRTCVFWDLFRSGPRGLRLAIREAFSNLFPGGKLQNVICFARCWLCNVLNIEENCYYEKRLKTLPLCLALTISLIDSKMNREGKSYRSTFLFVKLDIHVHLVYVL